MTSKEDPNINALKKSKLFKSHKTEPQAVKHKQDFKFAKLKPKSCTRSGYNHTGQQKRKVCKKCKRKDHFARMCLTRKDWKVHWFQNMDNSDDDYYFDAWFVGGIDCSNRKKKSDSFVEKLSIYNTFIFSYTQGGQMQCYLRLRL